MARFEALVKRAGVMEEGVQRVVEGETLKALARSYGVPYGKLAQWIVEDRDRSERYVNAKALCEAGRADEIHVLADGVVDKLGLGIANLKLKATQWSASKWDPARYGDSARVAVSVNDDRTMDNDARVLELARGVAFLFQQGADIAARREPMKQLAAPVEAEDAEPVAPDAPVGKTKDPI